MKLSLEEMEVLENIFSIVFLFAMSLSLGIFTYRSFKKKKKKWILITSSLLFVLTLFFNVITITEEVVGFITRTLENTYYNYGEISLKGNKYYRNGNLFTGVSSYINNPDSISIKIKDGKLIEKNIYKNDKKEVIKETFWENGSLFIKTLYINDKKEGIEEYYHENGSLSSKTPYKNDKKEGIGESYRENGSLSSKTPYKNDKIEGVEEHYRENGSLWWTTTYKNDKKEGIEETYRENGSLLSKTVYKNDKKVSEEVITNDSGKTSNVQTLGGVYTFESGYRRMRITITQENWFGWLEDGSGDGNYNGKTRIRGIIKGTDLYDEYGSEKRGYISGNNLFYNDPLGSITLYKQ